MRGAAPPYGPWSALALVLTLGLTFAAPRGLAKPSPQTPSPAAQASFDLTIIEASREEAEVDPRLDHLRDFLDRSFKGYKGFRQIRRSQLVLGQGESKSSPLTRGQELTLSFLGPGPPGFLKVRLEAGDLETTLDVRDGGLFFEAAQGVMGRALVLGVRVQSVGDQDR